MNVKYGGSRYKTFDECRGAPPVETGISLNFSEMNSLQEKLKRVSNMYFKQFPTIPYDSHGTGKFKDVKNLLRRVAIRSKETNTMVYDTYDVKNGETPESIAFKLYGDLTLGNHVSK